jgi:hypothetical protein
MMEEGGGGGPWSLPADSSLEIEPKPLQPKCEKGLTVIQYFRSIEERVSDPNIKIRIINFAKEIKIGTI